MIERHRAADVIPQRRRVRPVTADRFLRACGGEGALAAGEDVAMDAQSLPQVKMPNRDGFVSDWPPRGK